LSYSITENLNVEASCDFLRLSFVSTTVTDIDDTSNKDSYYHFGFGVNSHTLFFEELIELPKINIGITLKF